MRRHLRFANVIAGLCLFIVLGGVSWAASSINGSTIKKNSIPLNRLKGKLPAGAAGPAGVRGVTGTAGAKGETGAAGSPGAAGQPGTAGAAGAVGAKGATGTTGTAGANGAGIAANVRSSGPVNAPEAAGTTAPIALTGASWTQTETETDQLVGLVQFTRPAGCGVSNSPEVELHYGSQVVATAAESSGPGPSMVPVTTVRSFVWSFDFLASDGMEHSRTLSARVGEDTCPAGAWSIDGVVVDVTRAR
jgi:hypothetical protein